jgi:SulP family sulfate permease
LLRKIDLIEFINFLENIIMQKSIQGGMGTVLKLLTLVTQECLAGLTTALSLVPEVVSFSFVAGVTPQVSLLSSAVLCITMSILGGCPAMVTAAAGSVALVISPMVHAYGTSYILPTILLSASIQILLSYTRLTSIIHYIPHSVMLGFINSLGLLILLTQVPYIQTQDPIIWIAFSLTTTIVILSPFILKRIPSPLVAIVVVTVISSLMDWKIPNIGIGKPIDSKSILSLNSILVPVNMETLRIIFPTAISIACVGLMESLLTAKLVDDITGRKSGKNREILGLGIANIITGFFAGIAGCAMIGQTIVNVQLGGAKTRISTIAAGIILLLLVTCLSSTIAKIPMAILAGIMVVVAVKTISWRYFKISSLRKTPKSEIILMAVTIVTTVWTKNLAVGMVIGVILATIIFVSRIMYAAQVRYKVSSEKIITYSIKGPLFFASNNRVVECFGFNNSYKGVVIDLSGAEVCDNSLGVTLDHIRDKYERLGIPVRLIAPG